MKKAYFNLPNWWGSIKLRSPEIYNIHPLKFNIAPEKWWLEYYFPIGKVTFQGRTVKLQGGNDRLGAHFVWAILAGAIFSPWATTLQFRAVSEAHRNPANDALGRFSQHRSFTLKIQLIQSFLSWKRLVLCLFKVIDCLCILYHGKYGKSSPLSEPPLRGICFLFSFSKRTTTKQEKSKKSEGVLRWDQRIFWIRFFLKQNVVTFENLAGRIFQLGWKHQVWSNYSDLTRPKNPPNGGLVREIPGHFREI